MIDRIAPTRRPDGRPAGYQKWRDLSFLHWRVPREVLRPKVAAALELDDFEGEYFVGLVPFTMRGVRPWWAPPFPPMSNFHETNLRTYVHYQGDKPGVWFFSLDAANAIACWIARTFWNLPYRHAKMTLAKGTDYRYESRRADAMCKVVATPTSDPTPATPGTLEHFLAERYYLYAQGKRGLRRGQVHHTPYPLQTARVEVCQQTITAAAGLGLMDDQPPLGHFATGVDVEVFALENV